MRRIGWPAGALLVQPALSVAYLVAVRADHVAPSFAPVFAIGVVPLAVAAIALRETTGAVRWTIVGLAVVELLSVVLLAALVGWAKALRSG